MCNIDAGYKILQWSIENRNFINSSTISIIGNTGGSSARVVNNKNRSLTPTPNNKNTKLIKELILHKDGNSLFTVDSTNGIKQWDIVTGDAITTFNTNSNVDISKIVN